MTIWQAISETRHERLVLEKNISKTGGFGVEKGYLFVSFSASSILNF